MNVLLLQEHCEKIIPCPQSILKGGDNDNIIGILQKKGHIFMIYMYSQWQPKYKCNFYRKDNLTNKSWSRCLTCPRLDLWPFLDEEDEVDGASSSPTGSVRVAEVGSLMTHWISCRARAVTIWMDSSEFNLHHREIQTCTVFTDICIHWYTCIYRRFLNEPMKFIARIASQISIAFLFLTVVNNMKW